MHALTQLRFVQRDLCVSDIYFLGSMDAHPGEFRQEQTGRRYEAQQSCTIKVVNGFVNGSVFGATMSGLSAMARATQLQIGFPAAARVVLGSTVAGGISFGVGLGLYRGVTCSLQHARGVDDIKNSMIAGGLIGALSEIPVFIRSKIITRADVQLGEQGMHVMRPRPRFLFTATTGSILCGVVYMMEAGMRSAPVQKSQEPQKAPQGYYNQGSHEGTEQELDPWASSDSPGINSDWNISEPTSVEVLESEVAEWETK